MVLEKLRAHQSLLFRIESVLHEKFWQQEEEKKVHSELQGARRGRGGARKGIQSGVLWKCAKKRKHTRAILQKEEERGSKLMRIKVLGKGGGKKGQPAQGK